MEFYDVVNTRNSIRQYAAKPVPSALIERLVDAARRAPTARAVEPWEFIVVQDKDRLRQIADIAPNGSFIAKAQAAVLIFCRETKYYLEDGCAATENLLLAAAAEGLGACWIAGDKKDYTAQIREMFGCPPELMLVSIISLGYSAEQKKQDKKRSLDSVIHWERF